MSEMVGQNVFFTVGEEYGVKMPTEKRSISIWIKIRIRTLRTIRIRIISTLRVIREIRTLITRIIRIIRIRNKLV